MKEIEIRYSPVSPRRQEWRDRLQLVLASVSIIAGYAETLGIYTGAAIIQKRRRTIKHKWDSFEFIGIQNNVLETRINGYDKINRYFIEPEIEKQREILSYVQNLKFDNAYNYHIKDALKAATMNQQ